MKTRFYVTLLLTALVVLWSCDTLAQNAWTRYPGNPVIRGDPGSWWRKGVFITSVLYNPDSSRFEMWFTGSPTAGGVRPCRIGFAFSPDGISWTVHPEPVLTPSAAMWDSLSVEGPCVIRENGQYRMWYGGGTAAFRNRIGHATSVDGIHWSKSGDQVLAQGTRPWEAGGVGTPCVMRDGGGYRMWYAGLTTALTNGPMSIGYATSADGITWQRDTLYSPMVQPGAPGSWDSLWVSAPRVLFLNNRYHMWYTGANARMTNFRLGVATSSDGITNWVKDPANPIFRPSLSGWDAGEVECGTLVARGNTLYMWYDGTATPYVWQIGLATSLITHAGDEQALPTMCALGQNYPNPFNPRTTIEYRLPQSAHVTLSVYDLLGREAARLVDGVEQAGVKAVSMDASPLASGIYIYRLRAGEFTQTRKMTILK